MDSIPSRGKARAFMSHVPPASILQGAELVIGSFSSNFLMDRPDRFIALLFYSPSPECPARPSSTAVLRLHS
jgi:hypothetical protein